MKYFLSSLVLAVPCFWLPRIEAGDLSSHLYNAWLAELIGKGQAPGLKIVPQWTNVLFDLELSALWPLGPSLAAKVAAAVSLLIFVWGAFAFARSVSSKAPWFLLPVLAILSYGWVFHMGLFNFYLALGLAFWALALTWHPTRTRIAAAAGLLAVAYTAHALPVAWVLFVLAYRQASLRIRPRHRLLLLPLAGIAIALLRWITLTHFDSLWMAGQVLLMSGADQVLVYGGKYQYVELAVLIVWIVLMVRTCQDRGWKRLAMSMPLHLAIITAIAIAAIPDAILLPGYGHRLAFIAERMSLVIAITICATLAAARPRMPEMALMTAAAVYFFGFLYLDGRTINGIEERMEQAVAGTPPGARLVTTLAEGEYRVDPLLHMIDRVCIGRCFSYANYEPGCRAFRIRAEGRNPIVVSNYLESYELQTGKYKTKPGDMPIWAVFPAGDRFTVRQLGVAESFEMARLIEK